MSFCPAPCVPRGDPFLFARWRLLFVSPPPARKGNWGTPPDTGLAAPIRRTIRLVVCRIVSSFASVCELTSISACALADA